MTPPVASLVATLDAPIATAMSFSEASVLTGDALRAIIAERMHQIHDHGRTVDRDQLSNRSVDLPLAAVSYANAAIEQLHLPIADIAGADADTWPWADEHWHPQDPRTNLVKAAALIWAAIDWLDHAPRDAGDVVTLPIADAA